MQFAPVLRDVLRVINTTLHCSTTNAYLDKQKSVVHVTQVAYFVRCLHGPRLHNGERGEHKL